MCTAAKRDKRTFPNPNATETVTSLFVDLAFLSYTFQRSSFTISLVEKFWWAINGGIKS